VRLGEVHPVCEKLWEGICISTECSFLPMLVRVRQAVDYWVTVHSLKSLDGGILDQDDRLIDIVDDREQVEPVRCALTRR